MKKSIFLLVMAAGLIAMASCTTGSFVSNTGRLNYAKLDKAPQQKAPAVTYDTQETPMAAVEENTTNPVTDQPENTEAKTPTKPIETATSKTLANSDVATNSMAEEEELVEKSAPENNSKIRSYINTPAPKNTTKEKSQLTALLLCLILGMLGVHRFYLGKPLGGIIILAFTLIGLAYPPAFALAGLIVLFDAIRLLFGGLGPGW